MSNARHSTTQFDPADLKGGDHIVLGGRIREVFDTAPAGYDATIVRYLVDSGEVKAIKFYGLERAFYLAPAALVGP